MDVHLAALGCRLNEAERSAWARALRRMGHNVVAAPEDAQVIVLNTCAVTREAARDSRRWARRLRRRSPTARLWLTGCLASLEPAQVASIAGVDRAIPNLEKDGLPRLLDRLDPGPALASPHPLAAAETGRTRAFVKVQDGCRHRCTYCAVTVARGPERSRPVGEVVEEVRGLVEAGHAEVVLSGVHLGGYRAGGDGGLALLVRAVLDRTAVRRLRLSSIEPWELPDDFFGLWEYGEGRLCPHLHLPLQSGSDRVLRRMGRRGSVAGFLALVRRARHEVPGMNLSTDVIAGFPGESRDDLRRTADAIERIRPGRVHVFPYSPRAATPAAAFPGQLPPAERRARAAFLREFASRAAAARLEGEVGRVREVLWEGRPAVADGGLERWRGYTEHWLRAEALLPAGLAIQGAVRRVRVVGVRAGMLRVEPETPIPRTGHGRR